MADTTLFKSTYIILLITSTSITVRLVCREITNQPAPESDVYAGIQAEAQLVRN